MYVDMLFCTPVSAIVELLNQFGQFLRWLWKPELVLSIKNKSSTSIVSVL